MEEFVDQKVSSSIEVSESRVRLILADQSYVPIGTCGTLLNYKNQFYCIFWDTHEIELRTCIESDSFYVDTILDGYSFLTMDDVLRISFKNFTEIERIEDENVIREIMFEFNQFVQPMIQKRN